MEDNISTSSPPLLSALAVFTNILNHELVRSVHGYKAIKEGEEEEEEEEEEEWVEREFLFSPAACHKIAAPVVAPCLLSADHAHKRPVFHEGQKIGLWCCILAFDSVFPVVPSSPLPPMLSLSRNTRLKSVPCLFSDLEKVLQFQTIEEIPKLVHFDSEGMPHPDKQEKLCSEDNVLSSDSDEDCQSAAETPVPVKKQRAGAKHIASIALVDIVHCFHLPIIEASRTLKIGVTILKRKCREFGIPRWPHRKIKSLNSLIRDLQEEVHRQEKENSLAAVKAITRRKRMLETEKEAIQKSPCMDLMAETKLFRQYVFKRRHRAKSTCNR